MRTVDNYTAVLNGFLMWAQEKSYFPDSRRLPTAGQAIVKKVARNRRKDKANRPIRRRNWSSCSTTSSISSTWRTTSGRL